MGCFAFPSVTSLCFSRFLLTCALLMTSSHSKASPFHPLTGSESCYIDRYTVAASAANTAITLTPLEPRGCRYIEVHALCDDTVGDLASVKMSSFSALYRCYNKYHAQPVGQFACDGNALLNTIWKTGIESTRSCVEDTAVDGPCRERGEWTGDTLAVTLQNLVFCYDDVQPMRMSLLQSSQAANAEGVISGNCPENTYISDYALIWFNGGMVRPCALHCALCTALHTAWT